MLRRNTKLKDYVVYGILASGGFGNVYQVRKKIGKKTEEFAVKVMFSNKANSKQMIDTEVRSVDTISKLKSRYLCNYIEVFTLPEFEKCTFFVMEFCSKGDLSKVIEDDILNNITSFDFKKILRIFAEMAVGIYVLHIAHIMHRDIKLKNTFVDGDNCIKIGDFGTVKETDHTMDVAKEHIGTEQYMAPEIKNGKTYSFPCDIYSFGLTMYACIMFKTRGVLKYNGFAGNEVISADVAEFIDSMLSEDPARRPDIKAVVLFPRLREIIRTFPSESLPPTLVQLYAKTPYIEPPPFVKVSTPASAPEGDPTGFTVTKGNGNTVTLNSLSLSTISSQPRTRLVVANASFSTQEDGYFSMAPKERFFFRGSDNDVDEARTTGWLQVQRNTGTLGFVPIDYVSVVPFLPRPPRIASLPPFSSSSSLSTISTTTSSSSTSSTSSFSVPPLIPPRVAPVLPPRVRPIIAPGGGGGREGSKYTPALQANTPATVAAAAAAAASSSTEGDGCDDDDQDDNDVGPKPGRVEEAREAAAAPMHSSFLSSSSLPSFSSSSSACTPISATTSSSSFSSSSAWPVLIPLSQLGAAPFSDEGLKFWKDVCIKTYRITHVSSIGPTASVFLVVNTAATDSGSGSSLSTASPKALKLVSVGDKIPAYKSAAKVIGLGRLNCPYLLGYKEFFEEEDNEGSYAVVMDYCEKGSIERLIPRTNACGYEHRHGHALGKDTQALTFADVMKVISSVALALYVLHENGIVHGRVSPGIVYIDHSNQCRLGGLDSSVLGTGTGAVLETDGSRSFFVPHDATPAPTMASDVYSFGALAFVLLYPLVSYAPAAGRGHTPVFSAAVVPLDGGMYGVQPTLADLLKQMASDIPTQRPTMAQVLLSPPIRRIVTSFPSASLPGSLRSLFAKLG